MKICAYHGNLYLPEFKNHLTEIKKHGFDTILFCITETDMLYNLEIFSQFKVQAELNGFTCWANFWGGAGVFGGEALSSVVYPQHGINAVNLLYQSFLDCIQVMGFDHVFVDEPKFNTTREILGFINYQLTYRTDLNFHTCFSDDIFDKLTDAEIAGLPVKSFGLSAYTWDCDREKVKKKTSRWFKRLSQLRPTDSFVFLQGFELKKKYSSSFVDVFHAAKQFNINDFGFWSFRATSGTGNKSCQEPELVWELVETLFNSVDDQIMMAS
jgi:hypothetical protein